MFKKFIMSLEKMTLVLALTFPFICDRIPIEPPERKEPSISIGVISDTHYYDPSLGITSDAFQQYLVMDRKMLAESEAIFESVTSSMMTEDVEIVLVPGDLTKDGEKQCHLRAADFLRRLESTRKKVYVIPGNHDIDNPHAFSYPDGSDPVPIDGITPREFRRIYHEFGFDEAIFTDPSSLSYVAQPKKGIWILALDCCNYEDKYADLTKTAGRLSEETLRWIANILTKADRQDIKVFGMMHHGIVEHFPSMDVVFPEYLVDGWQNVASTLADLGLKVMFTGHHHATDISQQFSGDNFMIDIQTGSTVTWTCPYRIVNYNGNTKMLEVQNKLISEINYDTQGKDFQTYAYEYLATGFPPLVIAVLQQMGVDELTAKALEPLATPTMLAYYHGDEMTIMNPTVIAGIEQLLQSPNPLANNLGNLLLGVWYDSTPDGNVTIDLLNGTITSNGGAAKLAFSF